jgi:uncharacterized ferritin-like protein (DUF455 family)
MMQHVTAGHRWFSWVCEAEGVDPVVTFREQVWLHFNGPYQWTVQRVGSSQGWYDA